MFDEWINAINTESHQREFSQLLLCAQVQGQREAQEKTAKMNFKYIYAFIGAVLMMMMPVYGQYDDQQNDNDDGIYD